MPKRFSSIVLVPPATAEGNLCYRACIAGTALFGSGATAKEAVGDLVFNHARPLGLTLQKA